MRKRKIAALSLAAIMAAANFSIVSFAAETSVLPTSGDVSSGTYTLTDNVTLTSTLNIQSGATVTIDLNGHKITGPSGNSPIYNYGTLTIKDTAGTGSIENVSNNWVIKQDGANAQLKLDGGHLIQTDANAATSPTIAVRINGGTFTMNGGKITSNATCALVEADDGNGGAEFIMTGGELDSGSGVKVPLSGGGYDYLVSNEYNYAIQAAGKVTINGGTVKGLISAERWAIQEKSGVVVINDGIIDCAIVMVGKVSGDYGVTINGGTVKIAEIVSVTKTKTDKGTMIGKSQWVSNTGILSIVGGTVDIDEWSVDKNASAKASISGNASVTINDFTYVENSTAASDIPMPTISGDASVTIKDEDVTSKEITAPKDSAWVDDGEGNKTLVKTHKAEKAAVTAGSGTFDVEYVGGTDLTKIPATAAVTVTATPEAGFRCKQINVVDSKNNPITFNVTDAGNVFKGTFVMPDSDVTISAEFENIYTVTVTGGTADKTTAAEGETVTVTAAVPKGKQFKEWTATGGITLANTATATFTMPAADVTITAVFEDAAAPSNPFNPSFPSYTPSAQTNTTTTTTTTTPTAPKEPEKPTIKVTKQSANGASLEWSAKDGADGYIIEVLNKGKWERIGRIKGGDNTTFDIKNLSPATNYTFRVRSYTAKDGKRYISKSGEEIKVTTNPAKMQNFKAKAASDSVKLSWKRDKNADGYQLQMYRNGAWATIKTYDKNTVVGRNVTGLKANTAYKFRIRAFKNDENGNKVYGKYSTINVKTKAA